LFQLNIPSNINEFTESMTTNFSIIPKNMYLPRASYGLAAGPAPTRQLPEWNTGVDGFVFLVTESNALWQVDLYHPGAVFVANFTKPVLALESLGSWNSIYAVVNDTDGPKLASVNSETAALTIVSSLPYAFTSLTKSGSNFLATVALNSTHSLFATISSSGAVLSSTTFYCAGLACSKFALRGEALFGLGSDRLYLTAYNTSTLPQSAADPASTEISVNSECPTTPVNPYGCNTWYSGYTPTRVSDYFEHPTAGAMMMTNFIYGSAWSMPYISTADFSRSPVYIVPVVDLRVDAPFAADGALFLRDRAYCSGKGNFVNNRACVCDNAALNYGARCELTYSSPVAAPVAGAAPASTPVSSSAPVSGAPSSSGSTAPVAPKAPATVNSAQQTKIASAVLFLLPLAMILVS
jgi:hypothetical protein